MQPIETEAMTTTSLRTPSSAQLDAVDATVEELIGRIADLVLERQRLRADAAPSAALEDNRVALVGAHWQLSHALIARHCPPKADAA